MQYIRFLISFIVSGKYFIKLSHGESCPLCQLRETPQTNLSSYINQLLNNATANKGRPTNKIPFQGIIDSRTLNKKCCYNGGTCFLGTFCICPKQYTGRQCEYEKFPQDCAGGILNGEWVPKGCSLCRCFSGELFCLAPEPGCEEESDGTRSSGPRLQQDNFIVFSLSLTIFFKLYILL